MSPHLAFIYAYSRIFKRPPAEADMRHYFDVTAPSVHQMVMRPHLADARSRPKHPTSGSSRTASHFALKQHVIISVEQY
jgi:hypothetical protein